MLLGDGDNDWAKWGGGGAIATVIGGIIYALKTYLPFRLDTQKQQAADTLAKDTSDAKIRHDANEQALAAWKSVVEQQAEQIDRHERVAAQQMAAFEVVRRQLAESAEGEANCRENLAWQRGVNRSFADWSVRAIAALKDRGIDTGPVPELGDPPEYRPRRPTPPGQTAEFVSNQIRQDMQFLAESKRKIDESRPDVPTGSD